MAEGNTVKTEWELGAGVGAINFLLYPGSTQSKTYVLPLPYFTLRSEYLEIDRGIRSIIPLQSDWHFDISADLGLPVDSDDSRVRQGMNDLDTVIQFGPSLEYTISGGRSQKDEIRLELPLRTAISFDANDIANQGWLIEPRLVFESRRAGHSGLYTKLRAGLRYATQKYHAYYYDVSPAFVTPQRAEFESGKGYSGLVLDYRAAWRQQSVIFWGILRYQNLNQSVYEDSPLVEEKDYYFLGAGITWILKSNL